MPNPFLVPYYKIISFIWRSANRNSWKMKERKIWLRHESVPAEETGLTDVTQVSAEEFWHPIQSYLAEYWRRRITPSINGSFISCKLYLYVLGQTHAIWLHEDSLNFVIFTLYMFMWIIYIV